MASADGVQGGRVSPWLPAHLAVALSAYGLLTIAALHALFAGARVVLPASPSTPGLLETLGTTEGASLYVLPSTLAELLRLARRRRLRLDGVSRIITAGEKLDPGVKALVAAALPRAALYEYYGMQWTGAFALQVCVMHQAHHRGQMTVLMRQAGLVVPGTFGPAKEEWAAWGMPTPAV